MFAIALTLLLACYTVQFLIPYIFSVTLISSMLHQESTGRVDNKECYLIFTYTFFDFFFVVFHLFIIFNSIFDELPNFRNRTLTN